MTISDKVRAAVLERDGYACVCCGRSIYGQRYSLQHRRARKAGGSRLDWIDQPQNLLTVLGSATTECHSRMEARGEEDTHLGYVISEWPELDPRFIPVHVVTEFQSAKVWLTPSGGLSNDPPADALTWQDLLFCGACRSVKLHYFDGGDAACIACASLTLLNPDMSSPVIGMRFCRWCKSTRPVGHECDPDETPCQSRTSLGPCGICAVCVAAQRADLALHGSPSDLYTP